MVDGCRTVFPFAYPSALDLSCLVGMGHNRSLSSRPGLSSAASIRSGREVAATMYTPVLCGHMQECRGLRSTRG